MKYQIFSCVLLNVYFVLGDFNTIFYVEVDDSLKLGSGGGLQSEVGISLSSKFFDFISFKKLEFYLNNKQKIIHIVIMNSLTLKTVLELDLCDTPNETFDIDK